MKRMRILILTILLMFSLSGCGSMKTAWIAGRCSLALQQNPVTAMEGKAFLKLKGEALGIPTDYGLTGDLGILSSGNRRYGVVTGNLELLGMKLPEKLEIYQQTDEDTVEYFLHLDPPGLWTKGKGSWDPGSLLSQEPMALIRLTGKAAEKAVLTEILREEGTDYSLSMVLGPEEMGKILAATGAKLPKSMEQMDFSGVRLQAVLEIDGRTYLPKNLRLDLQGLNEKNTDRSVFRLWKKF